MQTTSQLPRRHWKLSQSIARLLLKMFGWRFAQQPPELNKAVIAVAPHTSNWDFVIGMTAVLALDLDANWLGKDTLFNGPWGGWLRKLGGIPVDRAHPRGILKQLVDKVNNQSHFILGVAPEGTRKPTSPWKRGCYQIAYAAKVPLVPAGLDYQKKEIFFFPHWVPGADKELEMRRLSDCYRPAMAKKPGNFQPHCQSDDA